MQMQSSVKAIIGEVVVSIKAASRASQILFLIVLLGYLLSFSSQVVSALSITPSYLLPPHFAVWTVLTSSFVERSIFLAICDLICIHLCGKLVEPLWGSRELVIYFLVSSCIVNLITTLLYILVYIAFFDVTDLFYINIHGLMGFNGAATVAVKQLLPDQVLTSTPLGRLKNTHIPCLVCFLCVILTLCYLMKRLKKVPRIHCKRKGSDIVDDFPLDANGPPLPLRESILIQSLIILYFTYLIMYIVGCLTGWTYLRFYQKHSNGTRGDPADHFSFASFFPTVLHPPIAAVAHFIFKLFVKWRICRPQPRLRFGGLIDVQSTVVNLPGIDAQDAERRRQKALRDLNERMKQRESSYPAWPNLEESESASAAAVPSMSSEQPSPKPHSTPTTISVISAGDNVAPSQTHSSMDNQ